VPSFVARGPNRRSHTVALSASTNSALPSTANRPSSNPLNALAPAATNGTTTSPVARSGQLALCWVRPSDMPTMVASTAVPGATCANRTSASPTPSPISIAATLTTADLLSITYQ
jgi:hypothetical protein